MIRRDLIFAAGALFLTPFAYAQPEVVQEGAVHIPFAPVTPAAFNIEMQTTYRDEEGEIEARRASYRVDLRGAAPSYEAVLTVLSAEGEDEYGFDPALLIGFPAELIVVLGPNGDPVRMSDWPRLREKLEDRDITLGVAQYEPRLAAVTLASPLALLALCQGFNQPVGVPQTNQNSPTSHASISTAVRSSREIRSVDNAAGVAHAIFEMVIESRDETSAPDQALLQLATTRAECALDLHSGVAQTAVVEIITSGSLMGGSTQRVEIAVTPLSP